MILSSRHVHIQNTQFHTHRQTTYSQQQQNNTSKDLTTCISNINWNNSDVKAMRGMSSKIICSWIWGRKIRQIICDINAISSHDGKNVHTHYTHNIQWNFEALTMFDVKWKPQISTIFDIYVKCYCLQSHSLERKTNKHYTLEIRCMEHG